MKQSYQYYFNGTSDGFLDYRSRGDEKAPGSYSGASSSLGASASKNGLSGTSISKDAAVTEDLKDFSSSFASDVDNSKKVCETSLVKVDLSISAQ